MLMRSWSATPGPEMCGSYATWWSGCSCWPTIAWIAPLFEWRCPRTQPVIRSGNGSLSDRMETHEREVILAELHKHNHKMTETARALGLERSHLYKKCQQLGIEYKGGG